MYATELIANLTFGPEALKVIGQAFDDAWAEIAGNFGEGQEEITAARTALARAVLVLATNDSRDAAAPDRRGARASHLVASSRFPLKATCPQCGVSCAAQ